MTLKGSNACRTPWIDEGDQAHGTGAGGDRFAMSKGLMMMGHVRTTTGAEVQPELGPTRRNGRWSYSRLQYGNACDTCDVGTSDPPLQQHTSDSDTALPPAVPLL